MKEKYFTKQLFIASGFIMTGMMAAAQNMNHPYSVYGIGDVNTKAHNRTDGMAGTGLAIKSSITVVDNNPAAIAWLPKSFYMLNAGSAGQSSTFKGDPINASNSTGRDFSIKRFSFATKLNNSWGSSVGIGQFSNVNYKFSGKQSVNDNTGNFQSNYEGDGGLNEYYWTNALALGKHFSLGIKSAIIAGAINQSENLIEESTGSVITTRQQDYIGDFRFQGGILFDHALSKKWDFSLGAKYSPKTRLSADRTLNITENDVSIVEESYLKRDRFYLPETFALGIALKKNKATTFAADYTYEDWSSLQIKDKNWQLINSHQLSGGVEFSKLSYKNGGVAEKKFYQLGAYFNSSYLQVRNNPIRSYGFTAGMGGWLSNNLFYSFSLDGGVRGTTAAKLIKETYFGFTLNLSYTDIFLSKGRRYD